MSLYDKGKTNLDFTAARDSEWQWHQLGHMQVCTSLQTDNHTSTPPLSLLQAGCPSCRPTNSIKALKAIIFQIPGTKSSVFCFTSLLLGSYLLLVHLLESTITYTHNCLTALFVGLPKTEWWDTRVVICLERDADLHMAQLMPLLLTGTGLPR